MAAASVQALACATLLLVVLVPHACMAASNKTTLQDRCESYAGGDRSSFDYDYCVWTLQRADKEGAANADALRRRAPARAHRVGRAVVWREENAARAGAARGGHGRTRALSGRVRGCTTGLAAG
jgi:hypothetical protein